MLAVIEVRRDIEIVWESLSWSRAKLALQKRSSQNANFSFLVRIEAFSNIAKFSHSKIARSV